MTSGSLKSAGEVFAQASHTLDLTTSERPFQSHIELAGERVHLAQAGSD